MVRKYKKRTYKPRKRTYKRRTYKRRYYKRRYKPIKKPEIHIAEGEIFKTENSSYINEMPFNQAGPGGMGYFWPMTQITSNNPADEDEIKINVDGKPIEGKKIRLKYVYIKGYIKVGASTAEDADDFNCKLMVFRWKRNTTNQVLYWGDLLSTSRSENFNVNSPSTWTESNRLSMMYKTDWNNDIKINFYKKVKNLYRKYDDANNIIPFKIRIPLYDCVLTCDVYKSAVNSLYSASPQPSTNGLYFTYLSNKNDANTIISMKYKLYYTDY